MSSQSGSELVEYDSECYEVQCIRDRKIVKGKKLYHIKWKDWQQKYNTWEPIENLQTVLAMVNAFEKNLQQGPLDSKKDNEKATSSKQSLPTKQAAKKTKHIQKQKKKRKNEQENEQQQSESSVVQQVEVKETKVKKDQKKDARKLANNKSNNNQISTEKQRPSMKEKQKQLEKSKVSKEQKEKQRQKQISTNRRVQTSSSLLNNSKTAQPSSSAALTKQSSKAASQSFSNPGDIVQISRINYHIMIPPQMQHLPAKLFYNVDRRNKITKKPLAVVDVSSEELLQKHPQMIVHYLENFVKQVEYYSYQKREYENRQNLQNQTQNQNGKTLLLQAKK